MAQAGLAVAGLVLLTALGVLAAGGAEGRTPLPGALPQFTLLDTNGSAVSAASWKGKITVLYFYSVRCPVCNDYTDRVSALARRFSSNANVRFVGIHTSSGGTAVPREQVGVLARVNGMNFPTLCDDDGSVARQLGITRTPMVVIADEQGIIRYRGAIDDNQNISLAKNPLARRALEAMLKHEPVMAGGDSMAGCSIGAAN
jgi:peroxiredoxin